MKAQIKITVQEGDRVGQGISNISIPYDSDSDIRNVIASALVQVLGVTLDKAIAQIKVIDCQQ
jgi:hypothetical protein